MAGRGVVSGPGVMHRAALLDGAPALVLQWSVKDSGHKRATLAKGTSVRLL